MAQRFDLRLRPPPLPSNVILNMPTQLRPPALNCSSGGPAVESASKSEESSNNKENLHALTNSCRQQEDDSKGSSIARGSGSGIGEKKEIRNIFGDALSLPIVVLNGPPLEIMHTMKILIVGNAKCGKSSVIARYVTDTFQENYKTTIGADFVRKDLNVKINNDECAVGVRLQLWDIAGQDVV